MTMTVEKLKKNDTIDCSRLLSTTLSLLNSPHLTYSQRGEALESIWAQERTGAHEGVDEHACLPYAPHSFFSPLFPGACHAAYIEQQ